MIACDIAVIRSCGGVPGNESSTVIFIEKSAEAIVTGTSRMVE